MKTLSIIYILIFTTYFFVGCNLNKLPDGKTPDVKFDPKFDEVLNQFYTCDKNDSELSLSQFDPKDTVIVKDKIESMDIVHSDCDGKQTPKGHGPIRSLSEFVTFEAPTALKEKVNFVQIENSRTCTIQKIDASEDKLVDEQTIEVSGQTIHIAGPTFTTLGNSGKLKILLSDSTFKMSLMHLNVHDKNNVLKINYYGQCLKYKETLNDKLGDAYNCLEAELLGEKQVLVSVQVERPDVPGIHIIDACTK